MSGSKVVRFLVLSVIGILVLGGILTAAYYQQEIGVYTGLQGWDTNAVEQFAREFVKKAHDKSPEAAKLLDPQGPKPVEKGGRFIAISQMGGAGPIQTPIRNIVPADSVKNVAVRIKYKAGQYEVAVEYPNGKWAAFGVARPGGALKIVKAPTELTDSKPQPQPWD